MKMKWDTAELHSKIRPLPNDFNDWAREQFFGGYNIYVGNAELYDSLGFSKKGRFGYCSHCRSFFDATKDMKAGQNNMCPVCSVYGKTYSLNAKKNATILYQTFWIGQNLGDGIFVLRAFRTEFYQWSPMVKSGDDLTDEINPIETRRLYIGPKGYYTEYKTWVFKNHKWEWEWAHSAGEHSNCDGPVYPDTYQEVKGTAAEWAFLQMAEENEVYKAGENYNESWCPAPWRSYSIWDYLTVYAKDRKTEMLLKLGYIELIHSKMDGYSIKHNWRAKNPYDYLRIWKPRIKDLQEVHEQKKYLQLFQLEREMGVHWTEEESMIMYLTMSRQQDMKEILQYMSLTQFINRIKTYKIRNMNNDLRHILTTYMDYLDMKERLGFDMTKSIYQFPKNLMRAHEKARADLYTKDEAKKNKIKERQFKNIRKRFENANKIYTYENGTLIIRPAMSATEILEEGRFLHHCVGGDNYLSKHNSGKDIILFIRKKKAADIPYITVEIMADGTLQQWYGKCDTKPNQKKIEKWLTEYMKTLDKKAIEKEMKSQTKGATA